MLFLSAPPPPSQFNLCKWGLKKQPAADIFSNSLLKKSALETQYIAWYHFQVTLILELISKNLLLPKSLSLLLRLQNHCLEKQRAFLFLFLCYYLRTTWSTPPEINFVGAWAAISFINLSYFLLILCFYSVSLDNLLLLVFLEDFGCLLGLLDWSFVRRVLWNFFCATETEAFDSFPSIFLASENQGINEMLKRNRYFKVVEDKGKGTWKRETEEGMRAVSPNWLKN